MTVGELIEKLQEYGEDLPVVLSVGGQEWSINREVDTATVEGELVVLLESAGVFE